VHFTMRIAVRQRCDVESAPTTLLVLPEQRQRSGGESVTKLCDAERTHRELMEIGIAATLETVATCDCETLEGFQGSCDIRFSTTTGKVPARTRGCSC
jgi:hypothetical protein